MPESHPTIGDAVGYAMAHNARVASGSAAVNSQAPPDVVATRSAAATAVPSVRRPGHDAAALRDMADRLTESAAPAQVAEIAEQLLHPETGVLARLTEVTAAAADWARARLIFDNPHHNPTFELWQWLNSTTTSLHEIREWLQPVPQAVRAAPSEPVDERHHDFVRRRLGPRPEPASQATLQENLADAATA